LVTSLPPDLRPSSSLPQLELPSNNQPASLDEVFSRANEMRPLFSDLREALDRSQFSLTERNFAAEFNPDRLADFVRTEIAFEQYPGVLRGATGTLIGRAGNALDQSVLLATLLEEAGYEWRIAQAVLSSDQAAVLVEQMAEAAPPIEPPPAARAIASELLANAGYTAAAQPEYFSTLASMPADPFVAVTEPDVAFIVEALAEAGIKLENGNSVESLIAEAQDYYWVEYRLDGFDEWRPEHPAFVDPAMPGDLQPETTFREVPEELYHRFRFEVFVEQKIGEERFVRPIVSNLEANTAALVGQPFTYQNRPDNLNPEEFSTFEALLADTSIFLPVLNGEIAGSGFDYDGRIYELDLLGLDRYGATELFQAVSGSVETAIGALGGLAEEGEEAPPDPNDYFALTAQWMEYTLIAPGGEEETFRRFVFDRLPPADRLNEEALLGELQPLETAAPELLTEFTVSVMPAAYNSDYTLERLSERMLQEVEIINLMGTNPTIAEMPLDKVAELRPYIDVLLQAALESGQQRDDAVSYRDRAAIVVHELGLVAGAEQPTQRERIDVVANQRRVLAVVDGGLVPSAEAVIRAGVWETMAERAPLMHLNGRFHDSRMALQQAREAGIPFVVLSPGQPDGVATISHDPITEMSVRADLERGYAVIIPQTAISGAESSGWWRVDPATGETLGVVTGGYGLEAVEYVTLFFSIAMGGISTGTCIASGSYWGCCVAMGVLGFMITFTLIMALSAFAAIVINVQAGLVVGVIGGISVDAGSLAIPNYCR
jgi:hypothetical protein